MKIEMIGNPFAYKCKCIKRSSQDGRKEMLVLW